MQFDQTLTAETDALIEHDPAGDAIQTHELSSGELLLTFSDEWCAQHDYRIGDVITFLIDETTGKLGIINKSHQERAGASHA